MIDLRPVLDRWHRLDVTVRDLPLGLGLAAAAFVPVLRDYGTQVGGLPARPVDAWAVLAIALQCLPLAVRRRWPAACVALVSSGFALAQLLAYPSFAGNALAVALVSTGAHLARRRLAVAGALGAGYAVLAVALDRRGGTERPDEYVTFFLALVLTWGIGAWLRSTRAAEAERRLRVAEDTRAAERTRIARELHDVVTHHVTAMVVQTEAARYLTAAPDRLEQTLDAVTDTGRRAIADLRNLLDVLDPGHDGPARAPSTGDLHALVEQTRRAGQPVELAEHGTPSPASGSAELVAYRVVQEALTNALKHARGSRTVVDVHYDEREIGVEVVTAVPGPQEGLPGPVANRPPGRGGRGLAGLRERVGALGGELGAGPDAHGGFVVSARIPTGSAS
ncbi:histidine kinase [Promicromonospora sp. NPDC052451]|uniref:histidine kinase n=1 Tax=Promicromonospora sp. NPDC052451 TaxID=3364407 RepID=UPI0037C79183